MSDSMFVAEVSALWRAMDRACSDLLVGVQAIFGIGKRSLVRDENERSPFWELKGGLAMRAAWYDPRDEEFVVEFSQGPVFRVPRTRLSHQGDVFAVELDEFGYGVGVAFADGSSTDFSADWVLYESCEEYRNAHAQTKQPVNFGQRVREVRIAKRLKAVEVAKNCGMAPSNYARLESNAHSPSMETMMRVSTALGVPLATLVARR